VTNTMLSCSLISRAHFTWAINILFHSRCLEVCIMKNTETGTFIKCCRVLVLGRKGYTLPTLQRRCKFV
jgi:hypothetical protein